MCLGMKMDLIPKKISYEDVDYAIKKDLRKPASLYKQESRYISQSLVTYLLDTECCFFSRTYLSPLFPTVPIYLTLALEVKKIIKKIK